MEKYVKPMVLANEELAEGVYAASGDCYTVTANIHQRPELGRGDYRIQVDGKHEATDNHHGGKQVLALSFNLPVTYQSSQGTLKSGDGTNKIEINYDGYHQNPIDNIGLGDVVVKAEQGLIVTDAVLYCNHDCGQH